MRRTSILVLWLVLLAGAARAESVRVDVELDRSILAASQRQTSYLRVALTGSAAPGPSYRAPLNVALVIDRSGSMAGEKLEQAKAAAIAALDHMASDDIVAVVAYDTTVSVLVPATKLTDRRTVEAGIRRLQPGSNTALFAGTVKGAAEVRKFFDRTRVNRVVLLSDGLANVGPDSPGELAELGTSLREEGIGVTTVGLGVDYNEDLMVALARSSGAAFTFVENARDLKRLYEHGFGGLAAIVASGVRVEVTFAEGFRPVRALGRPADIVGQRVTLPVAQLYADAPEELLLEFETPLVAESSQPVAEIAVRYHSLAGERDEEAQRSVSAQFSASAGAVEGSVNPVVMVSVVQRLADERARTAVLLRDQGRLEAAQRELEEAAREVEAAGRRYKSEKLLQQKRDFDDDSSSFKDDESYKRRRKGMVQRELRQFNDESF